MESNIIEQGKVFIPILPNKKLRLRIFLAASVPAFVLISASFSVDNATTAGGSFLKYFNIVVGFLIIIINYISYKKPEAIKWSRVDMTLVLSGLLILAQGAASFNPLNGFQPSHLLFLAGSFSIFKGVMLPEAKVKRGFIINNEIIRFRKKLFSKPVTIHRIKLKRILIDKENIIFILNSNNKLSVNLTGYENIENIYAELESCLT